MKGRRRKDKSGPEAGNHAAGPVPEDLAQRTRFVLMGLDATEKKVTASHHSGRIYLPLSWVGKRVKIIRLD